MTIVLTTGLPPQNFRKNRPHYGPIAFLGPAAVQGNASTVGVGMHFNPYVQWKGRVCS